MIRSRVSTWLLASTLCAVPLVACGGNATDESGSSDNAISSNKTPEDSGSVPGLGAFSTMSVDAALVKVRAHIDEMGLPRTDLPLMKTGFDYAAFGAARSELADLAAEALGPAIEDVLKEAKNGNFFPQEKDVRYRRYVLDTKNYRIDQTEVVFDGPPSSGSLPTPVLYVTVHSRRPNLEVRSVSVQLIYTSLMNTELATLPHGHPIRRDVQARAEYATATGEE